MPKVPIARRKIVKRFPAITWLKSSMITFRTFLEPTNKMTDMIIIAKKGIRKKEAIGRIQRKAVELSQKLEKSRDALDQANLSFELKRALKDLWQLRNEREHNWGDLINILQAVFASIDFELLDDKQKKSLRLVITDYLCNSHVEDADMERSIITLSENGLDPWVGISGNSE